MSRSIPVIVGSGRSGTTWVQDVLAQANGCATVFEPLHPDAIPKIAQYSGCYLRKADDCPELKAFLAEVFYRRVSSTWINYRIRPDRLKPSAQLILSPRMLHEWLMRWKKLAKHYLTYRKDKGKPVLAKFIRANLMLPWISGNFETKIAFVTRHPGAVIESKMRLGGDDWDPDRIIRTYLSQKGLVDDLLSSVDLSGLERLTPVGKHALIWCVENAHLLKNWRSMGLHRVYFEDLVYNPEDSWSGLCEFLSLSVMPEDRIRRKASQQARPGQQNKKYDDTQLMRWATCFSSQQVDEMQGVLEKFAVADYSMLHGLPLTGHSR